MKASQFLTVAAEKNSAVISANKIYQNVKIAFAGASCPASAPPFTRGMRSLQISVPTGEKALLALRLSRYTAMGKPEGLNIDNCELIIPVTWDEEKLIVGLDDVFVPPADRLLQLKHDLDIFVISGGQTFTTCHDKVKKSEFLTAGNRIVENPSLLLRFVLGLTTVEDLEAAATLDKREQVERELTATKASLDGALDVISELKSKLEFKANECSRLKMLRGLLLKEIESYRDGKKHTEGMDMLDFGVSLKQLRINLARERKVRESSEIGLNRLACQIEAVSEIVQNKGRHRTSWGFLPQAKVKKIGELLQDFRG